MFLTVVLHYTLKFTPLLLLPSVFNNYPFHDFQFPPKETQLTEDYCLFLFHHFQIRDLFTTINTTITFNFAIYIEQLDRGITAKHKFS